MRRQVEGEGVVDEVQVLVLVVGQVVAVAVVGELVVHGARELARQVYVAVHGFSAFGEYYGAVEGVLVVEMQDGVVVEVVLVSSVRVPLYVLYNLLPLVAGPLGVAIVHQRVVGSVVVSDVHGVQRALALRPAAVPVRVRVLLAHVRHALPQLFASLRHYVSEIFRVYLEVVGLSVHVEIAGRRVQPQRLRPVPGGLLAVTRHVP